MPLNNHENITGLQAVVCPDDSLALCDYMLQTLMVKLFYRPYWLLSERNICDNNYSDRLENHIKVERQSYSLIYFGVVFMLHLFWLFFSLSLFTFDFKKLYCPTQENRL